MHDSSLVPPQERSRSALLFAVAIFLSSFLLFLLEPIAGKRLLPLLGGSAAVWTACLVFFQSALLLGYFVAHWLATRTSGRAQLAIYVGLLVISLGQLALEIDPNLRANAMRPISSVLWLLGLLIGLPFITLSATSPLLQSWYARSSAARPGAQPYRLFAVSNVGSLLALLIYPWLLEPRLSLHAQAAALTIGFAVLAAVCGAIAYSMRSVPMLPSSVSSESSETPATHTSHVLWVSLAACGSLLLSAVTNYLSQNVATLPLLWIIPLVAYLLSFVAAFSSERWQPRWLVVACALAGVIAAGYLVYKGPLHTPILRAAAIFCVSLFFVCWFLHSELYRRRPEPRQLTTFYFYVAAGGALGAVLVGIVAPTVLPGNYELAFGLGAAAALGLIATWTTGWVVRGVWFATAAFMASVVVGQVKNDRENLVVRQRNFYGTLWVTEADDEGWHAKIRTLYHGVITHGRQIYREDLAGEPNTYYGHNSGVGMALDLCCDDRPRRVGVIGLGTGTLASYGKPGDVFRFYDINPAVEPIARGKFTYLRSSAAKVEVVTGDARISMANEPPQNYDVIAIDAFSGDAIPVHLITEQALELYKRHLSPHGIVAFHVSNRYLDLPPVVELIARRAGMKTAFISSDDVDPKDVWTSDWVLVTADTNFLAQPAVAEAKEDSIAIPPRLRMWTDDYNSLLPVLRALQKK